MTDSLLKKLHESFPDKTFEIETVCSDDFTIRKHIVADGQVLETSWNPERLQDVVTIHGSDVEESLEHALLDQVVLELQG